MTEHQIIHTNEAPPAIGAYSQGVRCGELVFLSGQIPLDPATGEIAQGDFADHVRQIFHNLNAVCRAAGGRIVDIVKLTVYLTDMNHFSTVNQIMTEFFTQPYPARAVVGVQNLPKGVTVEIDGIMMYKTTHRT